MPGWYIRFEGALRSALQYNLDDWLIWCNDYLYWVPVENIDGINVDEPSLILLQREGILSKWMDNYTKVIGDFLNSTESLTQEYRLHEYSPRPSGWKTFNQFFARNIKPGYRPIENYVTII